MNQQTIRLECMFRLCQISPDSYPSIFNSLFTFCTHMLYVSQIAYIPIYRNYHSLPGIVQGALFSIKSLLKKQIKHKNKPNLYKF